jgi:hypothetical protein
VIERRTGEPQRAVNTGHDLEQRIEAAGGISDGWVELRQRHTGQEVCVHVLGTEWVIEQDGAILDIGQYCFPRTPVTRRQCLSWAATRSYLEIVRVEFPWMSAATLLAAYARGQRCFQRLNLNGASLVGAHLEGIDLRGTRLCWADLSGTDLSGALLAGAELHGADLRRAQLAGVDLTRADLRGAHFSADAQQYHATAPSARRSHTC